MGKVLLLSIRDEIVLQCALLFFLEVESSAFFGLLTEVDVREDGEYAEEQSAGRGWSPP